MSTNPSVNVDKIQELLVSGNIAQFTPQERVAYINKVCDLTGLNPLTKPFEFLTFQGKMVMYAGKGCTDQLRKIHRISIKITKQEIIEGVLFVTVEGSDPFGRIDSEVGALHISGLKGDALANATMKAVTKAKRRLTLSMVGLGILDESEVEIIPGAHVDQSAYQIAPPSQDDFLKIRELLIAKNKTETGLLQYLSTQFNGQKIESIEAMNSAQIEYAYRALGGRPQAEAV